MTAPDSRDSVERVVAEMRCSLGKGCTPQSAIREWADRLQALARGPQQAGGEVRRFTAEGDIAYPVYEDPDGDYVLHTDYATLQAEVARLLGQNERLASAVRDTITRAETAEAELCRTWLAVQDAPHGEAEYITDSLLYVRGKDVGAVHDGKDKWDEKVSIRLVRDGAWRSLTPTPTNGDKK